MKKCRIRLLFVFALLFGLFVSSDNDKTSITKGLTAELVEKPSIADIPRLVARTTPLVPEGFTEVPYSEDHLPPIPTGLEVQQGFILYSRPITQAIHHVSVPQEVERIAELSAFATLGELEPVNFAVYALRDLTDFRVIVSPLKNDTGHEIPADNLDLRLVTEYPIGFPSYTSPRTTRTYRMTPELLERVTVGSIPSGESRRYWIIMRVPTDVPAGVYRGYVTMFDETNTQAMRIPLSLRVLGFSLLRDPTRHYTAYMYSFPRYYFNATGETLARFRMNEYKAMVDYGFDMMHTVYLSATPNAQGDLVIRFRDPEIISAMMEAGLRGPIVAVDAGFTSFYRRYVPGSTISGHHFLVSQFPETDEVYEKFEQALREFKETIDDSFPEIIIGPIDEPSPASAEIAIKALQAVQRAGFRSYMTVDAISPAARLMREHNAVDIYCMQPYSLTFAQIMADTEHEYWLYPNHNATEIRNTTVMQKGGRMTYGFGKWRSGYKVMIPWHWRWVIYHADHFDYLQAHSPNALPMSGSGNRMDEEGNFIPAIYWECFREGFDDYRYIYTLQQRIIERENSTDPECRKIIAEARKFLEDLWLDIELQPKYLMTEFWDDLQFDAYRWKAARFIEALLQFPKTNDAIAPTVIFDPEALSEYAAIAEDWFTSPNMEVFCLAENRFSSWRPQDREVSLSVADSTDLTPQRPILRTVLAIDHENDGATSGLYPIGWPAIRLGIPDGTLSLIDFDYIYFKVKIESNRSETEDSNTPLHIYITNYNNVNRTRDGNVVVDLGNIQRDWISVTVPVSDILANADSHSDSNAFLRYLRFVIFETDYRHATRLELDFADISLLRSKFPAISRVIVPSLVWQGRDWLGATVDMLGKGSEDYILKATLVDDDGVTATETQRTLSGARHYRVNLDTSNVMAGMYSFQVSISDRNGTVLSKQERRVEVAERGD